MMTVLIVDYHGGIGLGHIINLILGDGVDLHFVQYAHEATVGCLRSGLDDDHRLFQVGVVTNL